MLKMPSDQKARFQEVHDQDVVADIAAFLMRNWSVGRPSQGEAARMAQSSYLRGKELGLRKVTGFELFAYLVAEPRLCAECFGS